MTKETEALKKMYQILLTEPRQAVACERLEQLLREALAQTSDSVEPIADYWVLDDEHTYAEVVSFDSFREAKQAASDHGCGLVAYHRTLTRIDAAQPEQELTEKEKISREMTAEIVAARALAQQEPVIDCPFCLHSFRLRDVYTTPPQREWVGLTDEHIEAARIRVFIDCGADLIPKVAVHLARAIEAKLKELNT